MADIVSQLRDWAITALGNLRRYLDRIEADLKAASDEAAYLQRKAKVDKIKKEEQRALAETAAAKMIEAPRLVQANPREGELLSPDISVYAIGDIHGRADLLESLLDKIDADATTDERSPHIVFLGDYVDRGLQSKQVIDVLLSKRLEPYTCHFIKGNHEEAFLSFLDDPEFGPRWASYGGRETLVSYGIRPPKSLALNNEWEKAHAAFIDAVPEAHQTFLLRLQTSVRIGAYGFVHAGLRPGRSFDEQSERDLLWIRDEFLNDTTEFDVIVVHGHTPVDEPHSDHRRINVDTGAYFTGRLTAAKLQADQIQFLSTDV